MGWFSCDYCGDSIKKPKLKNHFWQCPTNSVTCIDCLQTFDRKSALLHNTCMTEKEKYVDCITKPKLNTAQQQVGNGGSLEQVKCTEQAKKDTSKVEEKLSGNETSELVAKVQPEQDKTPEACSAAEPTGEKPTKSKKSKNRKRKTLEKEGGDPEKKSKVGEDSKRPKKKKSKKNSITSHDVNENKPGNDGSCGAHSGGEGEAMKGGDLEGHKRKKKLKEDGLEKKLSKKVVKWAKQALKQAGGGQSKKKMKKMLKKELGMENVTELDRVISQLGHHSSFKLDGSTMVLATS